MVKVSLYHGWAENHQIWNRMEEAAGIEFEFERYERGYFDNPHEISKSRISDLLITHSYGIHWVPMEHLLKAKIIFVISGFGSFHPLNANQKKISQKIISKMLSNLENDPPKVVQEFHKNSFFPKKIYQSSKNIIDPKKLKSDLENLNQSQINSIWESTNKAMVWIHGSRDRIVSVNTAHELNLNQKMILMENAGHAIPETHGNKCWEIIKQHWVDWNSCS